MTTAKPALHIEGTDFKDSDGRTVMLRGVNLGGSTKVPAKPNGATHRKEKFYEYKAVTFVGRPFPAPEADEHFERLKNWGFNTLRFLVTWEAVERVGPGQYDLLYLDYVTKMVEKAGEYGFYVFIDPHQDVWSRWSGGDGAPAWTLEKVGFKLDTLHEAGAAFVHQELEEGEPFPTMRWTTNYDKLATATMFTLFFGGNDFAPGLMIEGETAQDFLQGHYIRAMQEVAKRVSKFPHVLGYDTLNEPHPGFIGNLDMGSRSSLLISLGPSPTPYQSFLLGAGYPQTVDVVDVTLRGEQVTDQVELNPDGITVWQEPMQAVWRQAGVWGVKEGKHVLKRPEYFAEINGRAVDFADDYMRPFLEKYIHAIRSIHPDAMMFVEPALGTHLPKLNMSNLVHAGHWYDAVTLFRREYRPNIGLDIDARQPLIGKRAIDRGFALQIGRLVEEGKTQLNGPSLVGEFGIAYDLNEKTAYENLDFGPAVAAMDRTMRALEANLANGTIWNYTADHTNAHGDGWNGEDLSIFSRDQIHRLDDVHDTNAGGRATMAFCRPFPIATNGIPKKLTFDIKTRRFEYRFEHVAGLSLDTPTEIYIPDYHYGIGLGVEVSDGRVEYDLENQKLLYWHTNTMQTHKVVLTREKGEAEIDVGKIETGHEDGVTYRLEHDFIPANGVKLHVVTAGPEDGEPVLLLHGFPEFWYGWKEQIPYLVRQGYRVIVPDQRGYNLSDKPRGIGSYKIDTLAADMISLLDYFKIEKTYLVGHDWGGIVSWWLLAKYSTRFKKGVLLNIMHPNVFGDAVSSNVGQMAKSAYVGFFQLPMAREIIGRGRWLFGRTALNGSSHPDTFTEADLEKYDAAWARPGAVTGMLNWYRAMVRFPPRLIDPQIRVPVLMLWGAQDVALGREMAKPSLDYCDQGELIFIEEATHWVQHDEPERVNRYIGRFLSDD